MQRKLIHLLLSTLLLASCGGGEQVQSPALRLASASRATAPASACDRAEPAHVRIAGECLRSIALARASGPLRASTALPKFRGPPATLTNAQMFDWVEVAFPQYFAGAHSDGSVTDSRYGTAYYRYWQATENYVAVLDDYVYVFGPMSGLLFQPVAPLAEFRCYVFDCTGTGAPAIGESIAMAERWNSAPIQSFTPTEDGPTISADAGQWIVGDTVSNFPTECGPTPNRAEVVASTSGNALRLTAVDTIDGFCADNVWVVLYDSRDLPAGAEYRGLSVPLRAPLQISFKEEGTLTKPQRDGHNKKCLEPPCYDNISLVIDDNHGNRLAYVMQRHPAAQQNNTRQNYREILLDPDQIVYSRDLFADFKSIPTFSATDARISSIAFELNEVGTATIADIVLSD